MADYTAKQRIQQVVTELSQCLNRVAESEVEEALGAIQPAPQIFVAGAGRTGLAMRGFAMRLVHLGRTAFVVGEATTPAATAGDLLMVGSGSGRTSSLVAIGSQAKRHGTSVLLFTLADRSPLAEVADVVVRIPAPSPKAPVAAQYGAASIQPMGSLFEQALFVLLDAMVLSLMDRMGANQDGMYGRHANLE